MIYVGIDDTDTLDTPGTNQLARALSARVASVCETVLIVRHQLLYDSRIPYTSKNGSASILLKALGSVDLESLIHDLRVEMLDWFKPGSDPGLCVTASVATEVQNFGLRCQREVVTQDDARSLAKIHGLHLEGLGGTEGGVIGALAAVGLIATGNDGRIVQLGTWPDDMSGVQNVATLHEREIELREMGTNKSIAAGTMDVGKHLRPNYRNHKAVLFASMHEGTWQAVRLP